MRVSRGHGVQGMGFAMRMDVDRGAVWGRIGTDRIVQISMH
jgi:hypothetical protein